MNAIWSDLFQSPVETWQQDEVPKLLSAAEIRNIPEVGKNAKTFHIFVENSKLEKDADLG